jgi:biotin-dependent carboxylase-like uncharacterized protein
MIEILKPGLLSTVQDLGRTGSRHLGVISAGALDQVALRVANRLVGNDDNAAAIEITVGLPFSVVFRHATRIALTGADCRATLDGTPIHAWWSVPVAAGQTLALQTSTQAMRTYLAVAGGLNVPVLLGSRSTDLKSVFGGAEGRALAEGDTLPIADGATSTTGVSAWDQPAFGVKSPAWCRLAYAGNLPPASATSKAPRGNGAEPMVVRVIRASEHTMFDAAAQKALWQAEWTITPNSNRMGYRLSGPVLQRTKAAEGVDLLSHAVLPGTIQVPPNGQPILLMGDAQTAGGYPKIGAVITADLWLLAQARLNTTIRFVECTREEALEAQRALLRYLSQVDIAIAQRPVQRLTKRETPRTTAATTQTDPSRTDTQAPVATSTATSTTAPSAASSASSPKSAKASGKDKKASAAIAAAEEIASGNIGERIMALSDAEATLPLSELVSELLSGVLKE